MKRTFNTTGPCVPGEHYMLPPEDRCPGADALIEGRHFFIIHAARQTGKTTLLKALSRRLNAAGRYHALYCSLESAQGFDEPERGIPAIVRRLTLSVEALPALAGVRIAVDLGLIREEKGTVLPGNPIYGEVMARTLNYDVQVSLSSTLENRWMDGRTLDMSGLLREFQAFWRDNSEVWVEFRETPDWGLGLALFGSSGVGTRAFRDPGVDLSCERLKTTP